MDKNLKFEGNVNQAGLETLLTIKSENFDG
jgi:hypothetical protein